MRWVQERLISYPRVVITLYVLAVMILIISAASSHSGLISLLDRPLGSDFAHYWMASSLALAGDPGAVYNLPKFLAAQEDFFKIPVRYAWFYPPTFLLLVYPLALLPYLSSLAVWLGITMSGYLLVLRRIAPHPLTLWLALSFPGTFENFVHGQNGFLTTLLVGGGLLLLNQHPLPGGFLLGLVSFKPQFLPLIPIALIAGRRWRALLAALMGAAALAAASYLAFGKDVWLAFFKNSSLTMQLLEDKVVPIPKMVTFFTAVLSYGAGFPVAWFLQGLLFLGVAALVAVLWYKAIPFPLQASALVLGMLLVTPYAFPYDLALLALPLAWLGWEGYNQGWARREPEVLFIGWMAPLVVVMLNLIGLRLTPLILLALLALVVRRSQIKIPILNCKEG